MEVEKMSDMTDVRSRKILLNSITLQSQSYLAVYDHCGLQIHIQSNISEQGNTLLFGLHTW